MLIRLHDRYLLRNFLLSLTGTLAVLSILAMIYLLFTELGDFLEHRASPLLVALYLGYSLPQFIVLVFPFACITAAYFSLFGMMRRGEIVALIGAGQPLVRLVLPLLIFGLLASGATGFWNEYVAAASARKARDIIDNSIKKKAIQREEREGRWLRGRKNRIFHVRWYDQEHATLHFVTMMEMAEDFSHLNRLIEAKSATWEGNDLVFRDAYLRTYSEAREEGVLHDPTRPVVIRNIDETPEDFAALRVRPREMNYAELSEFIEMLEEEGESTDRYRPELYAKLAFPLSCLVLILFAVTSAVRYREGTPALDLGILIAVGVGYYAFTVFLLDIAHRGILPAAVAAWGTNIIFGTVGGVLLARLNRR
jgi:lipopolysaccharide export system permease protein